MIDYERLKQGILNTSDLPLDVERLLSSAIMEGEFIEVNIKGVITMIFNKDYECVECYGKTITVDIEDNECGGVDL